jgi:hypothetical protein
VLDLPGTQREASFPGHPAGEDRAGRGALQPLPLPEGFGDLRSQRHDPIHLPFAAVNPDRALSEVECGPGEATYFAHAQAAPQHQEKHRAIPHGIDDAKERDDVLFRHGAGEVLGDQDVMAWEPHGGLGDDALIVQEGKEALEDPETGRYRARSQRVSERSLNPGIYIRGGRLRQVVRERGLARLRHEDREAFEGADGAFLHRRAIATRTYVDQIVLNNILVLRTQKMQ